MMKNKSVSVSPFVLFTRRLLSSSNAKNKGEDNSSSVNKISNNNKFIQKLFQHIM